MGYQRRTMKLVFFLVLTAIVCSTFIEADWGWKSNGDDCTSHSSCDSNICDWDLGKCTGCSRDSECYRHDNCLDGKCLLGCPRDSDCPTPGTSCYYNACTIL